MPISFDVLETQIARIDEGISQVKAQLKQLPEVMVEKIESQRHRDFYQQLILENPEMKEVTRESAAQNLTDVFKSSELKPGRDAREVVGQLFDKHEIKPTQQGPKTHE